MDTFHYLMTCSYYLLTRLLILLFVLNWLMPRRKARKLCHSFTAITFDTLIDFRLPCAILSMQILCDRWHIDHSWKGFLFNLVQQRWYLSSRRLAQYMNVILPLVYEKQYDDEYLWVNWHTKWVHRDIKHISLERIIPSEIYVKMQNF